jgi:hypothetical protein
MINKKFNSLEDFLRSRPLSVDALLDDGWGAKYPLKGCEIHATILFADISRFSARTRDLSSTETLAFANNFFAWISAEALQNGNGIIDKYIGDEIMIVFSKEFGSTDPLVEAIQAGRNMCELDELAFSPHIGIASGIVTIGIVGTALKYNCSVFGASVTLAARCANVKPDSDQSQRTSGIIILPENEWDGHDLDTVIPPLVFQFANKTSSPRSKIWGTLPPRSVDLKNIGPVVIREIVKNTINIPMTSAEERAKQVVQQLKDSGHYIPLKK